MATITVLQNLAIPATAAVPEVDRRRAESGQRRQQHLLQRQLVRRAVVGPWRDLVARESVQHASAGRRRLLLRPDLHLRAAGESHRLDPAVRQERDLERDAHRGARAGRQLALLEHPPDERERDLDEPVVRLQQRRAVGQLSLHHEQRLHDEHRSMDARGRPAHQAGRSPGAGSLPFQSFSTTQNGSLRCTLGARSVMYFGSHNSSSQIRLFSWPESSGSVTTQNINVSAWSQSSPYSAKCPDNNEWLSRTDGRITAAWTGARRDRLRLDVEQDRGPAATRSCGWCASTSRRRP